MTSRLPWMLVVAVAVALGIAPVWDYDVWFHLACGRDIVAARSLPAFDTLSYTAADHPWDAHEWLFDVLLYGLWSAGEVPLLIAVKAACSGLLGALLYARSVRHAPAAGERWIAAAVVIAGLWVCRWSLVERPQLLTFMFLAAEILMLESGRSPWALVALEIPWANLHGGSALLGPIVLGLWLAGRALRAWRMQRDTRVAVASFGWHPLLAMTAAVAVNPAGVFLFIYPLETMRDTIYLANVLEWMPPTSHEQPEWFIWFALATGLAAAGWRRWTWPALAVALPLAILPWSARRHIPLAVIALTPLAVCGTSALLARLTRIPGIAPVAAIATAAACLIASIRSGDILRGGTRDDLAPAAAMPALAAARPFLAPDRDVRLYTLHRWGGYAAWHLPHGFKTFIDGRQLVFGSRLFAEYYRMLENVPEAGDLLDRYAPDAFVLNYGTRLSRRLAADPDYALVHWDDRAIMYVRRSSCDRHWLERQAYRNVHPEAGVRGAPAGCLAELDRAARESPGHTRPLVARSRVLLELGRIPEALDAARTAVATAPTVPAVLLGSIPAAIMAKDFSLAEEWVARALRRGASTEDAGLAAGHLALARGDTATAERELTTALRAAERRETLTRTPPGPLPEICRRLAGIRRAAGDAPGAAVLLRQAGNALYTLGDISTALAAFREGLAASPGDARLRHNVGAALFSLGRVAESINAFRRALDADPAQPDTWAALGHAYKTANRPRDAVAAWRRCLELDPARTDVRQALNALNPPTP